MKAKRMRLSSLGSCFMCRIGESDAVTRASQGLLANHFLPNEMQASSLLSEFVSLNKYFHEHFVFLEITRS